MTTPKTGTREECVADRRKLLEAEKELTRRTDNVARGRQELVWVPIEHDRFDTDQGSASLTDLCRGRAQLVVDHFTFGPDYKAGCPSCSAIADGSNGIATHLARHDVMLGAISRAALAKLQAHRQRIGLSFPWASVMNVGRGAMTNRGSTGSAGMVGTDLSTYLREREGLAAFAFEDGVGHDEYDTTRAAS